MKKHILGIGAVASAAAAMALFGAGVPVYFVTRWLARHSSNQQRAVSHTPEST